MRIAAILACGISKTNLSHDFNGGGFSLGLIQSFVKADAFRDLIANLHDRVKMAGRILKNHPYLATTHTQHICLAGRNQISAIKHDRTFGDF